VLPDLNNDSTHSLSQPEPSNSDLRRLLANKLRHILFQTELLFPIRPVLYGCPALYETFQVIAKQCKQRQDNVILLLTPSTKTTRKKNESDLKTTIATTIRTTRK
jgi:hypothetical protein